MKDYAAQQTLIDATQPRGNHYYWKSEFVPGLSDGLIELRVDGTDGSEIQTTVVEGGQLGERKGINAPGDVLPASAITPKDIDDLQFGLSIGVDMVALSFVQSATDLRQARLLLSDANGVGVPLVAKLERPQALAHLDEILE